MIGARRKARPVQLGEHRARITLVSLMSRLTGIEDARGLAMPRGVTNIEQLRDMVEEVEAQRITDAGGYEPRHLVEGVAGRRDARVAEPDHRPLAAGGRW